jgi:YD repeat-containing protein
MSFALARRERHIEADQRSKGLIHVNFKSICLTLGLLLSAAGATAATKLIPIPIDDDLTIFIPVYTAPTVSGGQSGTETYSYDALGRLSQVNLPSGTIISYTYDNVGNRKTTVTNVGKASTGTPNCAANPALCS